MNTIEYLILHCSDSLFGSAAEIRRWHIARGWSDIGYHLVILNGLILPDTKHQKQLYLPFMDGAVEIGRRFDGDPFISQSEVGAHALGLNSTSLGICLIGIDTFTAAQFVTLARAIRALEAHPLGAHLRRDRILGHYQTPQAGGKTCPNFNVPRFVADIDKIFATLHANPTDYRRTA